MKRTTVLAALFTEGEVTTRTLLILEHLRDIGDCKTHLSNCDVVVWG